MFESVTQRYDLTDASLEILILLLVAFTLGYLLRLFITRKYKTQYLELKEAHESLQKSLGTISEEIQDLQAENRGLRAALNEKSEAPASRTPTPKTESEQSTAPNLIGAVALSHSDNLKKIEGIGPKIEALLNEAEIKHFYTLSQTEVPKLREILIAAGDRYKMHDPTTWPQQAELAAKGDWEKLLAWQDELKGGKEEKPASSATQSRALGVATVVQKDNLKKIEGIGPKIEQLLFAEEIFSFQQLSETTPKRLKEILTQAGERFRMHDPATWPEQAALAAKGEWDTLKKWQDELKGGRKK